MRVVLFLAVVLFAVALDTPSLISTNVASLSYMKRQVSTPVTVYLIDSGVSANAGVERVSQIFFPFDPPLVDPCNSHGMDMLKIIRDNMATDTRVVSIRAYNRNCQADWAALDGIYSYILANLSQPAIVSMSLGISPYYSDVLNRLVQTGTPVFAATGNGGTDDCYWPAGQRGVYAVTALTSNGTLQDFSNRCVNKTDGYIIGAPACSTSGATALTSAYNTRNVNRDCANSVDVNNNNAMANSDNNTMANSDNNTMANSDNNAMANGTSACRWINVVPMPLAEPRDVDPQCQAEEPQWPWIFLACILGAAGLFALAVIVYLVVHCCRRPVTTYGV